jgi:hypothetical protein
VASGNTFDHSFVDNTQARASGNSRLTWPDERHPATTSINPRQIVSQRRGLRLPIMLEDLDTSLQALLAKELPLVNEKPNGFAIRFEAPSREFNSKRGGNPALSLYLYNIQENRQMRGRTWQSRLEDGAFTTYRPDVKLDCSYMVTAWANEPDQEHRLLAAAARVFFRNPVLPKGLREGALNDAGVVTLQVAQPESFKDAIDIWSVIDGDLKPSLRVTVTIPLDLNEPPIPPAGTKPVLEGLRFTTADGEGTPGMPPRSTINVVATVVRGVVGRVTRGGVPVAGAQVRVGHSFTVTDTDGKYELRDLPKPTTQQLLDAGSEEAALEEIKKVAILIAADREIYMREQVLSEEDSSKNNIELESANRVRRGRAAATKP